MKKIRPRKKCTKPRLKQKKPVNWSQNSAKTYKKKQVKNLEKNVF